MNKSDVFTPENITHVMHEKIKKKGTLLEPSVGTGNLLKGLPLEKYSQVDIYDINEEYLNEIEDRENINKYHEDFLKSECVLYDNIIMNPPYIKIQDLEEDTRKFLKSEFPALKSGMLDIYYAFIIKCINCLKDDGIMVAITPNSFLYNKSAIKLREFLMSNKFIEEIIDFKSEKVFKGVSVYCCITIFSKKKKEFLIYNNEKINYSSLDQTYSLFNINQNNEIQTLKNFCTIKNGIATLRDKIYIHEKKLFNEPCWKPLLCGKVNKYIIYPYNNGTIIEEEKFKSENPETYKFLLSNKSELAKRDKGNKTYPTWYAFGRSQSLKKATKKSIYISCFVDGNNIENFIKVSKPKLFTGCLCIEPNDEKDLEKILESILTNTKFINSMSSKRSGGWITLSSRILYQVAFGK